MENTTHRSIRLGIFVTVGAVLFTVAIYLIGQKQILFSQTFTVRAHFNNVSGLQPGNNVRFSGINIGTVSEITILRDTLIEVQMRLRDNMRPFIKKDAQASIGTDGLMGNMLVNITPGSEHSDAVKNDDLIQTFSRIKTDDILHTLNVTNENAALLTFDLLEITRQVKRGQGTLSSLLYDTGLRNEIYSMAVNLRQATENTNMLINQLSRITTEVNRGRGTAGWLITDTLTRHQVKNTLSSLEETGQQLRAVSDTVEMMLQALGSGRGTLHTLVYDTAMAGNLRTSIQSVQEGTAKFNENMEALQHNVLLRRFFRDKRNKEKRKNQTGR